jgi:2-oxoglutarate dehydrogenase N-terminus
VNDFIAASGVKAYNSAAAEPFLNGSSTAYVEEMYNSWQRDPASVHAVSFRVFSLFGAHIDCRRVLIVKVAPVITRFSSIFLILVVGCLFPQQLILSTSLSCAFAKKSCVGQSVHGWLLSTSPRRSRTSSYGRPRRRQTH